MENNAGARKTKRNKTRKRTTNDKNNDEEDNDDDKDDRKIHLYLSTDEDNKYTYIDRHKDI